MFTALPEAPDSNLGPAHSHQSSWTLFRMSAKAMDLADKQTNDALLMLKRCEDTAHWPEWPDYDGTETIKEIDIPTYCYGEGEIEIEMGGETVTV